MTPIEALITAARRYCKENYSYWATQYSMKRSGSDFPTYSYSNEDYNLFPRYNALAAILDKVEMLVGKVYADLQDCRMELAEAGLSAGSVFIDNVENAVEKAAIQDERDKFVHFVKSVPLGELGLVEPLPHRRRLKEEEVMAIRQELRDRWNYDGDYWDPLEDKCSSEILFLSKDNIGREDHRSIIDFVCKNASSFLLEITEDAKDAEIDPGEFHPDCYETIYCDYAYQWVIYGSHEGTVTFAGQPLLSFIRRLYTGREHLFNQWPKYS